MGGGKKKKQQKVEGEEQKKENDVIKKEVKKGKRVEKRKEEEDKVMGSPLLTLLTRKDTLSVIVIIAKTAFMVLKNNPSIILLAILLRVILFHSAGPWLSERPEFATPLVAFERLREAVLLEKNLGDAYAGDRVHFQPILISIARFIVPLMTDTGIFALLLFFDVMSGVFFACGGFFLGVERLKEEEEENEDPYELATTVLKWYLLNPLSMMACASLSVNVIYIHIASLFTVAFMAKSTPLSVFFLAVWSQFTMYPVIVLPALMNRLPTRKVFVFISFFLLLSVMIGVNWWLSGMNWKFFLNTYYFTVTVADLTPNVGIFWYFFTEIFDHFRDFFLCLFQLNLAVYVIPLATTLRNAPHINLVLYYVLITVFVPYPSLSDATLPFALFPLIQQKYKQQQRMWLMTSVTLLVCVVLMPVTWHMWIVSGSGNANFYFGMTLVYNIAIIYTAIDLLFSYVWLDLHKRCPEDVPSIKTKLIFQ